jgi:hypothetical protein
MNLVPTPEEEKSTLSEQLQNRTRQCRNDSMPLWVEETGVLGENHRPVENRC